MKTSKQKSGFFFSLRKKEKKIEKCPLVRWASSKNKPMRLFFCLIVVAVAIWGVGLLVAMFKKGESIFDGISALFSGLAFAGMFCALIMQKQELSLQRQELADTREELRQTREATEKLADASNSQYELMKQQNLLTTLEAELRVLDTAIEQAEYEEKNNNFIGDRWTKHWENLASLEKKRQELQADINDLKNRNRKKRIF